MEFRVFVSRVRSIVKAWRSSTLERLREKLERDMRAMASLAM